MRKILLTLEKLYTIKVCILRFSLSISTCAFFKPHSVGCPIFCLNGNYFMGKWFSYHSNFGMWYIYSGLVHYYNPGHGTKCNLSCYNYIGSRDKKIKEPDVFNSLIVNLLLSKPSLDEKTLLNTWSFKHRQCIYKRLKGHNAHLSTNCKIFLSTQP